MGSVSRGKGAAHTIHLLYAGEAGVTRRVRVLPCGNSRDIGTGQLIGYDAEGQRILRKIWRHMNGQPYQPVSYRPARLPEQDALRASSKLRERMDQRRSVRAFSTDPVPEQLVLDAISVGATAPSGAHQQPWTFVLVTDPEIRAQIREAAEEEERRAYAGRLGEEWLAALRPLGTDEHKPHLTDAPYLIIVFEQRFYLDDSEQHKHYYVGESVGIAVGMLLTALHLAGLAALVHTPSPMRFLSEVLGRPRNEKAFAVIPVGYPADDAQVPDLVRKSLDQVLVRV